MYYILFALVLGAIAYATIRAVKQLEEGTKAVKEIAREFGLIFDEGGVFKKATLRGVFRGVPLNIYEESRHSSLQKHAQIHTLYRIQLTHINLPGGLSLQSEKFSAKIGKVFGAQDIQLDDPVFDKAFIIRGESADDVRAFLSSPSIREYLFSLNGLGGTFKLENNTLCLDFHDSIIGQYKVLRPRIELLTHCVHAMEQANLQKISADQPASFISSSAPQISRPIPEAPQKPASFIPSSPPKTSRPIPEEPQKMDNAGDSW